MLIHRNRRSWLTAVAEITLHNQSHWWVIPASLLFFGLVTAVQLAPYQGLRSGYGDGSLILFGSANLRYYIVNPIYLFIAANIGGHQRYDDLVIFRLGSRARLWWAKAAVFALLTLVYWAAVILFVEVAVVPFVNNPAPGWSEKLLAYYGAALSETYRSQVTVWFGTVWFVLLSWLGLGGVAFVVGQVTHRAGLGFVIAIALNLSGLLSEGLSSIWGLWTIADIGKPMLYVWSGELSLSFLRLTSYWAVWYFFLFLIVVWEVDRAGSVTRSILRSWLHGVWLIIEMVLGRLWFLVVGLGLVSVWIERQMAVGSALDSLRLVKVPAAPIASLVGPALETPIFSLIFLRWFLIFVLFLALLGETAVSIIWQQHVFLLPRLGSRSRWWLANVVAIAALALVYLAIFLGVNWLVGQAAIGASGLLFYGQIFALYWMTLTILGCMQLLLLLLTRSRSQTLLMMVVFLLGCWLLGSNYPTLLPWLPVAQTAVLAQLLQSGAAHLIGSLLVMGAFLLMCISVGLIVFQHHEFAGHLNYQ